MTQVLKSDVLEIGYRWNDAKELNELKKALKGKSETVDVFSVYRFFHFEQVLEILCKNGLKDKAVKAYKYFSDNCKDMAMTHENFMNEIEEYQKKCLKLSLRGKI